MSTIKFSVRDTDLPATVLPPPISNSIHNKMSHIFPRHRPPNHLTCTRPVDTSFLSISQYRGPHDHRQIFQRSRNRQSLSSHPPLACYILCRLTVHRRMPIPSCAVVNYALRAKFVLEGLLNEIAIEGFEEKWDFGARGRGDSARCD